MDREGIEGRGGGVKVEGVLITNKIFFLNQVLF